MKFHTLLTAARVATKFYLAYTRGNLDIFWLTLNDEEVAFIGSFPYSIEVMIRNHPFFMVALIVFLAAILLTTGPAV